MWRTVSAVPRYICSSTTRLLPPAFCLPLGLRVELDPVGARVVVIALTPALLFNDFACEFGFRGHTFQNIRLMEGLQGLNTLFICPYAVYSRKIRPREASEGGFRKVESELNVPSNEKRGVLKKEKWVRRTVSYEKLERNDGERLAEQ